MWYQLPLVLLFDDVLKRVPVGPHKGPLSVVWIIMRNYIQDLSIIVLVISVCIGCDTSLFSTRGPAKPLRFSTGSKMRNLEAEASGEVWGVRIHIAETNGGGISSTFVGGVSATKGALDAKQTIIAGDVTIEFAADGFEPISLKVNSKEYGTIEEGDELSIDADRNVTINSELRMPL